MQKVVGSIPTFDQARRRRDPFLLVVILSRVSRFVITIEGPNFKDVADVELSQLPSVGDTIETKYGTCIVTNTDRLLDNAKYMGKIDCRLP